MTLPHELRRQRYSLSPGSIVPAPPGDTLVEYGGIRVYPFPDDYIRPSRFGALSSSSNYPHFGPRVVEVEFLDNDIRYDERGEYGCWRVGKLVVVGELEMESWMKTSHGDPWLSVLFIREFPELDEESIRDVILNSGDMNEIVSYLNRCHPSGMDQDVFRRLLMMDSCSFLDAYMSKRRMDPKVMRIFLDVFGERTKIGGFPLSIKLGGEPSDVLISFRHEIYGWDEM